MSRCTLVIANAGSGKTWTLANRVLRWVIESRRVDRGADPARILAVTFTRKAAGEILARIVSHAARGAADGDAGARARREFEAVVGPATREEYADALAALCASMHRLQIGTIDGFFHRIASAVPGEIGLPAEWSLGEEHELEELRARAAAEVLADDDADELVSLLERGEPKPSVTAAIAGLLGGSGFSPLDVYRATAPDGERAVDKAFGWVERLAVPGDLSRESWDRAVADAETLESSNGHWRKALDKLRAALRARDFAALAENGFLDAMREGRDYQRLPMGEDFVSVGERIAAHLRHALVADLARKLRGARAVLPRAQSALARLQRAEGVFGFGDVSRGVARAAGMPGSAVADPAALRAALGADIRDLAIDEAQDTSVEQFASLRPLLGEVLGGARDGRFLLVGDPKQSIYGWRGGTPGLIARVEDDYAGALGPGEALTKSFRSSPLVMEFVNEVFAELESDVLADVGDDHRGDLVKIAEWAQQEGLPPEATEGAFARALAQWRFARHESAKPDLAGRIVAYRCGKVKATKTEPERVLEAHEVAAAVAERLHREDPARSIAILVRTNQEIADTIAELRARGIAASDEGRSTLLDSPVVAATAEFLRLIDDPGDRIAHFVLSRGAMARVTGLAPLEDHPTREAAFAAAAAFAAVKRAKIADQGLAAVLRALFEALRAQGLAARDADRLARVVAIAEESDDRPCARPIDLLDAIRADKADGSSASAVRVMTVHRAKGLEFDEVILPALDEGWGQAGSDWGMLVDDPTKPPLLAGPLMNEDVRRWVPELRVLERDERRRGLLDDLSALYVALTRARQGVHLVMDHAQGGSFPTAAKLISRVLRRATVPAAVGMFANAPSFAEAFAVPFDIDVAARAEAFWSHEFGAMPAAAEVHASPIASDSNAAPEPPPVRIVARAAARAAAPSEQAGEAKEGDLWPFDPFTDDDVALRGVLVHECFREIESVAAIATAPERAALVARAARRAAIEKGEPVPAKLVGEAEALLARVAVGATGAALGAGPAIRVRTELPFVRDSAGGLVHGRIDRLELELRDGRIAGARIVDFKTGAVGATGDAFAKKVRGYFGQLAGYAAAVAEMHGLEPGAIRLALLFVDRDEVVEKSAASIDF